MEESIKHMAANCLAARIRVLDRAVSAVYNKAFRPHGLKVTQVNIIVTVAALGPMGVKPLCDILSMDSSTLSRALARIEKKGYVHSEPSGKGKNLLISVTDEGREAIRRAYPAWQKAQAEVGELLGADAAGAIRLRAGKMLSAAMADTAR